VAATTTSRPSGPPDAAALGAAEGVVVHVRDARSGEVVIMGAESEVTVTDKHLVAALGAALRRGKQG
jgi:hypothetical protein